MNLPRFLPLHRSGRWLSMVSTLALLAGCGPTDLQDLQDFVAKTKAAAPGVKLEQPPEIEPYQPFTYNAQGFKDPFVPSTFAQQQIVVEQPEIVDTGIRPDPDRVREELEKYTLASLKMVGVIRKQDGDLWALIKAPDGIVYRVKQGNYMGADQGKITTITEQRIELVEIVAEGNHWIERNAFLALE
jgi:type IV pilus assembly protein PilP